MEHHAETDPLYRRICAFEIDDEPVARGFVARLARENGWSRRFAARVVEEYKRFLYLCATADVPRTPSDQVDQAWHLHLTYTRSYWGRLCRDVLPRPVHHQPTRGGAAEREKFHAWYEGTLSAYRAAFGCEPPRDIWPPAATRFGADTRARRVNTARSWVIAKPWARDAGRPWLRWAGIALLLALAAGVIGCTSPGAMRSGVRAVISVVLFGMVLAGFVFLMMTIDALTGQRDRNDGSCGGEGGDGDGGEGGDGGGDGCGGCGGCGCG